MCVSAEERQRVKCLAVDLLIRLGVTFLLAMGMGFVWHLVSPEATAHTIGVACGTAFVILNFLSLVLFTPRYFAQWQDSASKPGASSDS